MQHSQPDISLSERWTAHQRRLNRTTLCYSCIFCDSHPVFSTEQALWEHCTSQHHERLPSDSEAIENFRKDFVHKSGEKRPSIDNSRPRRPNLNEANRAQPEPGGQGKRPLSQPLPPATSISGIRKLVITPGTPGTPGDASDVAIRDASDGEHSDGPRKRPAIGSRISQQGSASSRRDGSPSPPRRSKARVPTGQFSSRSETDLREADMFETQRPPAAGKSLWTERDPALTRSSFQDSSNHAATVAAKSRNPLLQNKSRKLAPPPSTNARTQLPPTVQAVENLGVSREPSIQSPKDESSYDIILQPETRPISQEQLVAEVKGIYAGLVMVEAKCIEVDNKQATLAQADPTAQPKLNNEQWQALIALHRTLLHEHHDFFLASQHPSASPALRRLATKYAMPARMWRHGIHSFLELLRHRLPSGSLDHMLAFIYLAYSMMALLYETVPAFEDTWIECLGDLGRYRMAIEDDDIRDRQIWTGVARHWYSKASDKAPTTGRLYHHLAILARPNALQQLFYYSKSLCVVIPFTSARESILTLFEPVLKTDGTMPPLDHAFVKAHGLLFTNRSMEKFEPTSQEFLALLDNQIGRVTRKFMEQGYQIAAANNVAMMEYGSKTNVLMKIIAPGEDVDMANTQVESPDSMAFFKHAQWLSNSTLEIVLRRIGDPNVLPFIHVTLVWLLTMARHPAAMEYLHADFPWELLSVMLNTLLAHYGTPGRIENDSFPLPEKDEVRPFPEDFAMRGLLWADDYFPPEWFTNEKIDEEEKYHELPSMTQQRKERILWLACKVAARCSWLKYDGQRFSAELQMKPLARRSMTFASATTADTSGTSDTEYRSDAEEDLQRPALLAATPSHD